MYTPQEVALEELKKELQTRPTTKLIDDLRKKVKILQVCSLPVCLFLDSMIALQLFVYLLLFNILKIAKESFKTDFGSSKILTPSPFLSIFSIIPIVSN